MRPSARGAVVQAERNGQLKQGTCGGFYLSTKGNAVTCSLRLRLTPTRRNTCLWCPPAPSHAGDVEAAEEDFKEGAWPRQCEIRVVREVLAQAPLAVRRSSKRPLAYCGGESTSRGARTRAPGQLAGDRGRGLVHHLRHQHAACSHLPSGTVGSRGRDRVANPSPAAGAFPRSDSRIRVGGSSLMSITNVSKVR